MTFPCLFTSSRACVIIVAVLLVCQFAKLNLVIELAGGVPMLMEEGTDDNDDNILVTPGTCVMSSESVDKSQISQNARIWIQHVTKFLKKCVNFLFVFLCPQYKCFLTSHSQRRFLP